MRGAAVPCEASSSARVSSADLCAAVSKKKVDEVRCWIEGRMKQQQHDQERRARGTGAAAPAVREPNAIVITGPPGSGKRTTIEVLCRELDVEIVAWEAPTPTLWSELQYTRGADGRGAGGIANAPEYTSKIDEFEAFLRRATVMATLPLTAPSAPGARGSRASWRKVVVVDDLPHAHRHEHQDRLRDLVYRYARASRFGIAFVLTSLHKSGPQDMQRHLQDRLGRSLIDGGAPALASAPAPAFPRLRRLGLGGRMPREAA